MSDLVSRRQFLSIVGLGAAATAGWKLGLIELESAKSVSEARVLMGTIVNVTVIDMDESAARSAVVATLDRMAALEGELSRFRAGSAVAKLNREGELVDPPQSLRDVLAVAEEVSVASGGAFDVTIKPLIDLYDSDDGLPTTGRIAAASRLVDYQGVSVGHDAVRLAQPGMAITLDGVAKGYIVDAGVAEMRSAGYADVLVEAGGDLVVSGKRFGDDWSIAVRSPRSADEAVARVVLAQGALATSGDYHKSYTADMTQHHILDPRTGYSAPEAASVSVVAPTAARADAYATAMMVMGSADAVALAERSTGVEAFVVTKELATYSSSGFPAS